LNRQCAEGIPRCPFDIAINDADIHWKITKLTGDADKVEEAIAFIENQQVEVEVLHRG
jgi:hypothetical protein